MIIRSSIYVNRVLAISGSYLDPVDLNKQLISIIINYLKGLGVSVYS